MATIPPRMMKAAVMYTPGGPEVLKLQSRQIPTPEKGQVLIKVKSFGINRSELFTRQGHSPGVEFPRILGIEAAGIVEEAPGNEFQKGEVVATCMGGMGRMFDGGYAEYTCVPATQVKAVKAKVSWETLGALPILLETAWNSLFICLNLQKGDRLLIRGATSAVGLAAAAIAKQHGAFVAATTRKAERANMLRASGADEVILDSGSILEEVKKRYSPAAVKTNFDPHYRPLTGGFDKVLELVGAPTLIDSMRCAKAGGIVCATGTVGNKWALDSFQPNADIPTSVCLTAFSSSVEAFLAAPLDDIAQQVEEGAIKIPIKTFQLGEINVAHRNMDENTAEGKMVVLL